MELSLGCIFLTSTWRCCMDVNASCELTNLSSQCDLSASKHVVCCMWHIFLHLKSLEAVYSNLCYRVHFVLLLCILFSQHRAWCIMLTYCKIVVHWCHVDIVFTRPINQKNACRHRQTCQCGSSRMMVVLTPCQFHHSTCRRESVLWNSTGCRLLIFLYHCMLNVILIHLLI